MKKIVFLSISLLVPLFASASEHRVGASPSADYQDSSSQPVAYDTHPEYTLRGLNFAKPGKQRLLNYGYDFYNAVGREPQQQVNLRAGVSGLSKDASAGVELLVRW